LTRQRGRALTAVALAVALVAEAAACSAGGTDTAGEPSVIGDGDEYEATIRRTEGGIPHITGETLADVSFGQGWASGEDRTCDLADQVMKINGDRSLWLGRGEGGANVESDIAWKTIGIVPRAMHDWVNAAPDVIEMVTGYTDGWNAHLEHVGPAAVTGWCAGADWLRPLQPVEVYAYARSIALMASSGALARYLPSARPPWAPPDEEVDNPPARHQIGAAAHGTPTTQTRATQTQTQALGAIGPLGEAASSGWAIGRERSARGGGLLLANPASGWEGELRFWEVHLTVPGDLDVYGAQLSSLPGVAIGFNENVAWTQTVSPGHRFTAYRLDLVPGEPTTYRYGDDVRRMEATDVTVDVLDDDGSIDQVTRRMWSTHYGPVVDLPGIGWTEATAVSYRDANLDDDEVLDPYLGMARSRDLDQLVAAHRSAGGVPLFGTVATSRDGRAWYGDTSATPNLSPTAIAAYEASLTSEPQVRRAAGQGVVLLDGSEPVYEWVDADGARDAGLVPLDRLPGIERADYVFNAGDSFWLPHAEATIEGDYSPLVGDQATARSPRTRETATLLGDTSPDGPAGDDGRFTLDELAGAALDNGSYTASALRRAVVDRCDAAPQVFLPGLPGDASTGAAPGTPDLPPAGVYVGAACAVLARWDGTYDVDQAGPPLWREMLHQFDAADLRGAGRLWARPFDPRRPVDTPSGLAPAPDRGRDPVLDALARAVQILDSSGIAVDATLGDVQFAQRGRHRIPIHGGDDVDGTTNVVGGDGGRGTEASILDPQLAATAREREPVAAGSTLGRYGDVTGYLVDRGTSFLLAVELTPDGPRARTLRPYADSEDRKGDDYAASARRFSDKQWRTVAFTDDEIADETTETLTVRG
jgi:acyl-homoserine-lactone acylase